MSLSEWSPPNSTVSDQSRYRRKRTMICGGCPASVRRTRCRDAACQLPRRSPTQPEAETGARRAEVRARLHGESPLAGLR